MSDVVSIVPSILKSEPIAYPSAISYEGEMIRTIKIKEEARLFDYSQ